MKPAVAATKEDLVAECIKQWEEDERFTNAAGADVPGRIAMIGAACHAVAARATRTLPSPRVAAALDTAAVLALEEDTDPVEALGRLYARIIAGMTPAQLLRWRFSAGRERLGA